MKWNLIQLDLKWLKNELHYHITLKRKYGKTIEDILFTAKKLLMNLMSLLNRDERLAAEQEKLAQLIKDLEVEAEELIHYSTRISNSIRKGDYGTTETTTYGKSII